MLKYEILQAHNSVNILRMEAENEIIHGLQNDIKITDAAVAPDNEERYCRISIVRLRISLCMQIRAMKNELKSFDIQ